MKSEHVTSDYFYLWCVRARARVLLLRPIFAYSVIFVFLIMQIPHTFFNLSEACLAFVEAVPVIIHSLESKKLTYKLLLCWQPFPLRKGVLYGCFPGTRPYVLLPIPVSFGALSILFHPSALPFYLADLLILRLIDEW